MRHVKYHEYAVEFYEDMKSKFVQEWGSPDLTVDFTSIPEAGRREMWTKVVTATVRIDDEWKKAQAFAPDRAEGCHVPNPKVAAQTQCLDSGPTVDPDLLNGAMKESPCQGIANLIQDHENYHARKCKQLLDSDSRTWSFVNALGETETHRAIRQTPAGHAQEEIDAHGINIGGLKEMVAKLDSEKRCRTSFTNATLVCTIGAGDFSMHTEQRIDGFVCGDPLANPWTIRQTVVARGGAPRSAEFQTPAVEWDSEEDRRESEVYRNARKGSIPSASGGGWMMAYRDHPRPSMIIRNFRISMCIEPAEEVVPVRIEVTEGCK